MTISQRALSQFDLWFMRRLPSLFNVRGGPDRRPITITAAALVRHSLTRYAIAPSIHPEGEADLEVMEGGYLALRDAQGCHVSCHSGRLWVTEEDKFEDGTLVANQELRLSQPGKTLILALVDSRLSVR